MLDRAHLRLAFLKAAARDPIENAFMAFIALSHDQRQAKIARFNAHQEDRHDPVRLHLE